MLLAVLIAWAVTSGGGKGGSHDDSKAPGSSPAGSITPGPSGSGPAISEQPGGGGESNGSGGSDGDEDGSSGGGSGGGSAGTGGSSGSSDANGGGQETGSGSASGSASGSGSGSGAQAARQVPAGSSLPDCAAGSIRLTLKTELSYSPDEKPKFRLFATNTSSTACKADFGPKSAVFTVTEAGGDDDEVWSSKDCPRKPAPVLLEVPAGTTVVHTVEWDRARSAPKCATPPPGKAKPGTYLVEAKAPGEPVQRASFVLAKD
ncbi:hypothetical protein JCM13580A_37160 [Streptomyces drozdowiczii]|uniref:hypothetical protein n=1 Tax=Streptomyces drozdowiczii TaxID=202862 RepID=UPI0031ECFB2B